MPVEVILPKVDMDMESGILSLWLVAEGDAVAKGDPLFEIETDKSAMEIESPSSGILQHVLVAPGTEVPIGQAVAWIYAEDEDVGDPPQKANASTPISARDDIPEPTQPQQEDVSEKTSGLRATPAARKLGATLDVDLSALTGSGPRGRIQRADVEAFDRATNTTMLHWPAQAGELNLISSGSNGTPLVMIHGFGADASGWEPLMALFSPGQHIDRIELPNHGKSPLRPVNDFADLVAQIRDRFDLLGHGSVDLLGHSLGGAVALALADTRPKQVQSLTLLNPGGLGPEVNTSVLEGILRASRGRSMAPWLRQLVHDPRLISDSFAQAAAVQMGDPDARAAREQMKEQLFPDGTQAFDLSAALQRISCPTRIIWGKRDKVIPWHHAMRAPGQISLNLFDDIGHMPHLEAPDAVHRLMAAGL